MAVKSNQTAQRFSVLLTRLKSKAVTELTRLVKKLIRSSGNWELKGVNRKQLAQSFRTSQVANGILRAGRAPALAGRNPTGLRSFVRFLEFTGRIRQGLACAVPSPACPPAQPPLLVLDQSARHRFLCCFDRAKSGAISIMFQI